MPWLVEEICNAVATAWEMDSPPDGLVGNGGPTWPTKTQLCKSGAQAPDGPGQKYLRRSRRMSNKLTREAKQQLAENIVHELEREPTICVIGVSGSAKSSTLNTMFHTALPISHTVACTKRFEANELALRMTQGQAQG